MRPGIDSQWWRSHASDTPAHTALYRVIDGTRDNWSTRRNLALRNAELANIDLSPFGIASTASQLDHEIVSFNVALNVCETVAGKATVHKVVPFAAPDGAKASLQRKAAKFNSAISGLFQDLSVFDQDHQWTMDTLTWDAAVAKVCVWDKQVSVERVFSFDIHVDPYEARYGWRGVRSLYHRHAIDRERLVHLFKHLGPEVEDAIRSDAGCDDDLREYNFGVDTDMVIVTEAWHLPSGKKARDGRYVLALRNVTLIDEEYTKSRFPFAFYYETRPRAGVWQIPLMSRLASAQYEYDVQRAAIQEAIRLAIPKLALQKGDEIAEGKIDDDFGQVVHYNNVPPQYLVPQPIHPDVIAYTERIPQDMLRFSGVNEMAANGQVPRGLSQASGKALQVFSDEGSERLAPLSDNRQRFYVEIGEMIVDACRDLVNDGVDVIATLYNGRSISRMKFKDVDLGEGKYKIQVQPTSFLAKTPSAKYQQLSEMRANEDITPIEFRKLLGVPDLQAANEYETASLVNAEKIIEGIIDGGVLPAIMPTNSLDILIDRTTKAIELAYVNDESKDTIELLHEFLMRLDEESQAQAPPPAQPPMPPGPPMDPGAAMVPPPDPTMGIA